MQNPHASSAQELIAADTIDVSDEPEQIYFDSDDEPEIEKLIAIYEQSGPEALTNEEYALVVEVLTMEAAKSSKANDFHANLAEHLSETELNKLSQKILQWVEWDEESRSDWYEREKKGIAALGLSKDKSMPLFPGAAQVTHPVIGEACIQFSSRAIDSLWPAGGPVKTSVLGFSSEEKEDQAGRVEKYMNYQYTSLMPGAFSSFDKMVLRLPISGSCFTEACYDPIDDVHRKFIEPAYFLVPYNADDLQTTQRYTVIDRRTNNAVRKLQVAGYYRDIELPDPGDGVTTTENAESVDETIRDTEGRADIIAQGDENVRTIYRCICELDIPGFEDVGKDGKDTGIELQYRVEVDKDSQKILAIYRNWKPGDEKRKRLVLHTHYRFLPGLGFYGYGFYHWIGGLSDTATGALRALLDSAAFSNLQGGYRSKDAAIQNGDTPLKPGEWKEVDADAEDLTKGFFKVPYGEPSSVLFNLLGHMEALAGRFASTTESMVGDGNQNTPVGTILARIEQGSKIHTGIQRRIHEAFTQEMRSIAYLNSQYLNETVAVQLSGEEIEITAADFDDRIDIIPVSDPNFVSNTQRYFVSQAILETAQQNPNLYNMREVHRRVMQSLRVEDDEELLPDPKEQQIRRSPLHENADAMMGKPLKAYQEQDHQSHIALHQQVMATMPKDHPGLPSLQAHIQEHMATAYLIQMQQMTGIQLVMPDEDMESLPIEVENKIAQQAAQAVQQMQQEQQKPSPEELEMQAEQQRKDQVAQVEQQRKDEVAAAEQERKDRVVDAEIARKDELALAQRDLAAEQAGFNAAMEAHNRSNKEGFNK